MDVLVLGAGGHGQVVADVLLCMHRAGDNIRILGFLDDDPRLVGGHCLELPIFGSIDSVTRIAHDAVIIGVGDNAARQRIYRAMKQLGERFAKAVHPKSVIASNVCIGEGTVICAGVVVNTGTTIGANSILNTACTVDHHNWIGDHVHIAPGAHLGGDVSVGDGVLVGIGAVVLPQRRIGEWAVIGAGAVVTKDVPPGTKVIGTPARPYP
jgi:sugar O-acyltransferase (sialic acid O-acetyltransferase NeuD family)